MCCRSRQQIFPESTTRHTLYSNWNMWLIFDPLIGALSLPMWVPNSMTINSIFEKNPLSSFARVIAFTPFIPKSNKKWNAYRYTTNPKFWIFSKTEFMSDDLSSSTSMRNLVVLTLEMWSWIRILQITNIITIPDADLWHMTLKI